MNVDRLALLAHELRSPVAALAAIAAAYPTSDTAQRRRLLELGRLAGRSVQRLAVDASVTSVRLGPLDVGAVVCDAVEAARLRGGPVRADVGDGLPLVAGDADRLRQALDNLIGNAVGHSPAGAEVTVSAHACGSYVRLAVCDRGEGIPESALERVFDPGVRLTDARPGSGLGLAIVRSIAAAVSGLIWIGELCTLAPAGNSIWKPSCG